MDNKANEDWKVEVVCSADASKLTRHVTKGEPAQRLGTIHSTGEGSCAGGKQKGDACLLLSHPRSPLSQGKRDLGWQERRATCIAGGRYKGQQSLNRSTD